MYRCIKETHFSASHHLRNYNGKCERVHGHNWRVQVVATGRHLGTGGMLIDFGELKAAMKTVLERLDHNDLNAISPFDTIEPSAENIARYTCEEVGKLVNNDLATITEVHVWETVSSCAVYTLEDTP